MEGASKQGTSVMKCDLKVVPEALLGHEQAMLTGFVAAKFYVSLLLLQHDMITQS